MSSSIGVRLLRVPQPVRRKILALAFDLPDEEERLADLQLLVLAHLSKLLDILALESDLRRQAHTPDSYFGQVSGSSCMRLRLMCMCVCVSV